MQAWAGRGQCQENTGGDSAGDGVVDCFRYSVSVQCDVNDFGTVSENVKDNMRGNAIDDVMDISVKKKDKYRVLQ